jgi:2-polyprenyl-6-methoxyphenol hydroxylase-like FAD-dependent oxidoreductase
VLDLAYADLHPAAHGLGIHRSSLFDLLFGRLQKSAAQLITGIEIEEIADRHLTDKQGRRHGPFDLIVVADGAHSGLRQRLMPAAHAPLYPWGCLWTTVADRNGVSKGRQLQQRVRGTGLMMGLLPVGPRDGNPVLTMYWSLPIEALQPGAAFDLAAWRETALQLWPDASDEIEQAAVSDTFARATYRHVALPHWAVDNVLFIGDAAHGTSPQLGQGANLGLMDAFVLADALTRSRDLETALMHFAKSRTATVRFYRQASHLLTPFFQSHAWPLGAPLGLVRDLFMGWSCHLPVLRPLMTRTLSGLQLGWLESAALDDSGCAHLSGFTGRHDP